MNNALTVVSEKKRFPTLYPSVVVSKKAIFDFVNIVPIL